MAPAAAAAAAPACCALCVPWRVVEAYKEPQRCRGHSDVRWANVYVKRAANKVLGLTMSTAMSSRLRLGLRLRLPFGGV